jgi:hypothetical protein
VDEIARRYLLLGLRLARHLPDAFGRYLGPPELAEAVAGEALALPAELHDEALALSDAAVAAPRGTAEQERRAAWLEAQLGALAVLARRLGGEEVAFVDLVEQLFGIAPQREPEATFTAAQRMLSHALPGRASLRRRLARHAATTHIPPPRVLEALREMVSVLRAATRAQLWLPEDEAVEVLEAHDQPRWGQMTYLGRRRSEVRVNLDRPIPLWSIVELAARECYPGRHAEAAVKDAVLRSGPAGSDPHEELALTVELSPAATVTEGMATFAREVVMTDGELGYELRRLARRLDMEVDIEAELLVQRALRLLLAVPTNAALLLHRDGQPPAAARSYLREMGLLDEVRLEAKAAWLRDPLWAGYAFTYPAGRALVGEWLERQGQTHGYQRLLQEQLTPSTLRAELGEPPSLYPDSFA